MTSTSTSIPTSASMRGSPPPRPPPRPRPHPQLARSWARRRTARRVARRTLTLAVRGGPCAARWAARCRCTSLPTSLLWQLSSLPRVLRTRSMGGPLTLQVKAAHGLVEMSAPTLGQARRTHAARTPHARRTHARAAPALRPLCAPPLCAPPRDPSPPPPHRSPATLCARRPLRGRRRSHARRAPFTRSTARSTRSQCCCRCRPATPPPRPPRPSSSRLWRRSLTSSRSVSRCLRRDKGKFPAVLSDSGLHFKRRACLEHVHCLLYDV